MCTVEITLLFSDCSHAACAVHMLNIVGLEVHKSTMYVNCMCYCHNEEYSILNKMYIVYRHNCILRHKYGNISLLYIMLFSTFQYLSIKLCNCIVFSTNHCQLGRNVFCEVGKEML